MKRIVVISLCFLLFGSVSLWAQHKDQAYLAYIDTYKSLAIKHQKSYGIPASITLAQGLIESGAGQSELAREANNHFGIKCHSDWRGKRMYHDDDKKDDCFRQYNHPEESFEDHARFLKRPRYASLYKLKATDYRGWAKGLKACGYATDKSYANKLIQTIELYELYQYDGLGRPKGRPIRVQDLPPVIIENPHQPYRSWGLLYIEARDGDSFETIATEFGISPKQLAKYNDVNIDYPLAGGEVVYLEKKNKKGEKGYEQCVVRPGESMHTLAQRYGIRMKNLYKLNRLPDDYTPEVGNVLRLR